MMGMRPIMFLLILGAAAVTGSACGSSDASVGNSTDVVAVPVCRDDSDCPTGQVCRSIRLGESEKRNCVVDSLHSGSATGVADDAGDVGGSSDAGGDADEGGLPDSGTPPTDPPPTDAGNDVTVPPTDAGNGACTSSLTVTITAKGPYSTCQWDTTVVESSPATLHYPCAGGTASVVFGAQTFTGDLTSGKLSVQNVHTYPFPVKNTGTVCDYTATQTITGTLASGSLHYDYSEVLTATSPLACKFIAAGCAESGPVSVGP
jgi:Cys-rich repeat protein